MIRIGHRGACGYKPENTLSSFAKALEIGVEMVELDVFLCKSGELVVFHDHYLSRMTNGNGYVEEKTLDELKKFIIYENETIPTLSEVLDLLDKKVAVNIELKGKNTAENTADLICKYLLKGWQAEQFLVSSFNHLELLKFKTILPKIRIGVLNKGMSFGFEMVLKELSPYSVHLQADFVEKNQIETLHAKGLKVYVYTVNVISEIKRMRLLGVDGVFSDYPDRI